MRTLGSKGMDPAGCNKDHSPLREIVGSNVDGEANVNGEAAVVEGFLPDEHLGDIPKARVRRASEGSQLTKGDGKRSSGELRCDKCGKGYKHSSCLTKHLSVFPGFSVCRLLASCPKLQSHAFFIPKAPSSNSV